jgi:cell wall-associated NlpC family hydrolase
MDAMEMPRRTPFFARGPALVLVAVLVAAGVLALVLVLSGGSGGAGHAHASQSATKAPKGEIDLTALSAQQLRPVAAKVDKQALKVHPQLVRVAGVGTDGFTSADPSASASTSTAQAPTDAQVRNELAAFKRDLRSSPGVPVGQAAGVRPDGTAVAPVDAPAVVAAVIQAANQIARTPYKWGGGHGAWADTGYDCSGSVSFALAGAGLLDRPLVSTQFEHWGAPGPGRWITIYSNSVHAWMTVAGLRFDTGGLTGPRGTRWQPSMRSTAGFAETHPPGL